ncbi:hypothetical protein M8494_22610 [Serratia ureilytica]
MVNPDFVSIEPLTVKLPVMVACLTNLPSASALLQAPTSAAVGLKPVV